MTKKILTLNFSDQHLVGSNLGSRRITNKTILAGHRLAEIAKNCRKPSEKLWINPSCTQKIEKSSPKSQKNVRTVGIEDIFFLEILK